MPDAYNPWGAPVFPTADDNAMQPETFVPQGVQDWTRQAAPKDYNILSQIAGSLGKALMYPGQVAQSKEPISTEDMVGPAFNLAGMLTLGAGAAPQEANALNMGIKAYHGSPHDFDKFDLSKIGTGEGAQAYGHGLYFADNEAVAKAYRDALTPKQNTTIGGSKYSADDSLHNAAMVLQKFNGDRDAALNWMQGSESMKPTYDILKSGVDLPEHNVTPGHMYEVNINADPSHFLDWDKPLSQQHPKVQEALPDLLRENTLNDAELNSIMQTKTGQDAVRRIARPSYPIRPDKASPWEASGAKTYDEALAMVGGDKTRVNRMLTPDASYTGQALNQAGIPGIKYLDQGSRGAGQGSSNYVVFNHDLIDIMRKYAVPGMLGAPILANALSEQKT